MLQKKLTNLTDMSIDLQIILTDMSKDFTNHSYGYEQRFTDNSKFFSYFLSEFIRIYPIFSDFPGFSSYLCIRKYAASKKGGGVIIFMKVLKNDEALPSEIDSRAFFVVVTETRRLPI